MADLSYLFESGTFKASTVDMEGYVDGATRQAIPRGQYVAEITGSEVRPTNGGTGTIMVLKLAVSEGKHKGSVIFDNINLINESKIAQRIGQQRSKEIMAILGLEEMGNTDVLHGEKFTVGVKYVEPKGIYDASNSITYYKAVDKVETAEKKEKFDKDVVF